MEDLLLRGGAAWEALRAQPPWTAGGAKVGKAQLGIPAREGEGKQDSVGGTWGTSDREAVSEGLWQPASPSVGFPGPPPLYPGLRVHTWRLGDDHHVAGQPDVAGRSALEGDGRALEVVEHVHDRGEVQVLHTALAPLRQRQAQVLRGEEGEAQAVAPAGLELGGAAPPALAIPWLCLGS